MLIWHCSKFEYKPTKKAIKDAEEVEKKTYTFDDILVFFISVEKQDKPEIIDYAAEEIIKMMNEVKASRVLLYPYAHLSSELASPDMAKSILNGIYSKLAELGVEVYKAPFGYYKEFKAEVKGHPLAERSRVLRVEEALKRKKEAKKKTYYVVTPQGEIFEPTEDNIKGFGRDFKIMVEKEALGKTLEDVKHEMLQYLKRFGFEWEPRSDFGHMRMAPYAAQIFDTVAEYARLIARSLDFPVYEIKGTAFFDLKDKAVREHAELYGDRLYKIGTDKGDFVLRYAACHQQFSLLGDWYLSYKNLPLGMLEVADAYRYEQSGEVELSFRLRRFWMPDLHVLVESEDAAKEMLLNLHEVIMKEAEKLNENYELLINMVNPEAFERYKDFIIRIAKIINKPVLVAVYPPTGLSYYWTINIEYHIIDYVGRPREIGTVQIDIGNSERFGIEYVDENGNKKRPVILHTAILGTIERYIYMLFDYAMKRKTQGKKPMLPFWISPVQVRIIPMSNEFMEYAEEIANKVEENGFRVDIDDTNRTLKRKILDAEKEWVPYIIIIGKREVENKKLSVRIRASGEQKIMSIEDLIKELQRAQGNYPKRYRYYPKYLSIRPQMIR